MVRSRTRGLAAGAWLVAGVLALTACGDDVAQEPTAAKTSQTPSGSAPADAPECSDVWSDGARIPRSYKGCVDESGSYVERDVLGCSSGQQMVRYGDHFYGMLGGTAYETEQPLDEDRDYRAATRRCSA